AAWRVIFLIFFCFLHTSADDIDVVCKTTEDYDLCANSLRSDPSSSTADAKGMALIMIQLALYKATHNIVFIKQQMIMQPQDPSSQQCLQVCYQEYNFIINYFILDCIQDMSLNRYHDASFAIALSGLNVSSCTDACVNCPSFNLTGRSKEYAYFVQVVADVIDFLY
ncbi:hypothetical protein A4A49_58240, partial [Nicotiana attenuata]